jgi:hypothetical protein
MPNFPRTQKIAKIVKKVFHKNADFCKNAEDREHRAKFFFAKTPKISTIVKKVCDRRLLENAYDNDAEEKIETCFVHNQ